jgi:pimeloyl-ACP methyl ester carboxylesterase
VAAELALRQDLAGLILENTFTSIPDIGAELFPWMPVRRWSRIKYDTCSKLPDIRVPVLIMHSRGDELIGFSHGEKNLAAACEPKLFWELRGSHNDALSDTGRFVRGIEQFLRMMSTRTSAQAGVTP